MDRRPGKRRTAQLPNTRPKGRRPDSQKHSMVTGEVPCPGERRWAQGGYQPFFAAPQPSPRRTRGRSGARVCVARQPQRVHCVGWDTARTASPSRSPLQTLGST